MEHSVNVLDWWKVDDLLGFFYDAHRVKKRSKPPTIMYPGDKKSPTEIDHAKRRLNAYSYSVCEKQMYMLSIKTRNDMLMALIPCHCNDAVRGQEPRHKDYICPVCDIENAKLRYDYYKTKKKWVVDDFTISC